MGVDFFVAFLLVLPFSEARQGIHRRRWALSNSGVFEATEFFDEIGLPINKSFVVNVNEIEEVPAPLLKRDDTTLWRAMVDRTALRNQSFFLFFILVRLFIFHAIF
jgi:hypothetical protein